MPGSAIEVCQRRESRTDLRFHQRRHGPKAPHSQIALEHGLRRPFGARNTCPSARRGACRATKPSCRRPAPWPPPPAWAPRAGTTACPSGGSCAPASARHWPLPRGSGGPRPGARTPPGPAPRPRWEEKTRRRCPAAAPSLFRSGAPRGSCQQRL